MGEWNHGMCGCFDNCGLCIVTYFFPCYTAGKIGEAVGDSCILCGLAQVVPILNFFCICQLRSKVREAKGIDGGCCGDTLAAWCCPCCALIQSGNEMGVMGGGQAQEMSRQ